MFIFIHIYSYSQRVWLLCKTKQKKNRITLYCNLTSNFPETKKIFSTFLEFVHLYSQIVVALLSQTLMLICDPLMWGRSPLQLTLSASFSVPRPGAIIEDITPAPEPVIPTPPATITLNLGGVSLERFIQIEEEFRKIIADMATIYINTHGIDPGLNNT